MPMQPGTNNYTTPAWKNNQEPSISAAELTAMGQAIELAQHPYCVCNTAANQPAKDISGVNFSGYFAPSIGAELRVLFTNGNTAPNPELFYTSGGAAWSAGTIVVFVRSSSGWHVVGGV